MAPRSFTVSQEFTQPLSVVFAHLAEHDNLGPLFGMPVKRIRAGSDPSEPNGVGSVRLVSAGPVKIEETITAFERDRRIEYRVTRGGFMKYHLGELRFSATAAGCRVEYTLAIESALPLVTGPLLAGLERGIARGLRQLSRQASL